MSSNPELQFAANIYCNGVRHTVYGYVRDDGVAITRDSLSDFHGTVYLRGRVFNVYGNRDPRAPYRGQSFMVPPVSDLFPPRAADIPSAVRMRFGSPPRHADTASSSRRPVSPSDVRQTPPFILPSQNEVPETERSVPPDVPPVVENGDPNADAFVRGPRGIMQFGRAAPLHRPLPLGTDIETEGGRSDPAATVVDLESQPEPEAEPEAEGGA